MMMLLSEFAWSLPVLAEFSCMPERSEVPGLPATLPSAKCVAMLLSVLHADAFVRVWMFAC